MKNKKVLIAIIAVLVIVIAAVAVLVIVKPFGSDDDKKKAGDYETVLKKFAKACSDEDEMEKFVEKYVDYKSMYVLVKVNTASELKDKWKNTEKEDYEDEDFIDEAKEFYSYFVDEDETFKVTDVEESEKYDVKIKDWTFVEFTIEKEEADEEIECGAIFCDGKLALLTTLDTWKYLFEAEDDDDDDDDYSYNHDDDDDDDDDDDYSYNYDDDDDDDTSADKDDYNSKFYPYDGEEVKGSEVTSIMDDVIASNKKYIGEKDKFIMVSLYDSNYNKINDDLYDAVWEAYFDNNRANVTAANDEISKAQSDIKSSKKYKVTVYTDYSSGYVYEIDFVEKD